MIPFFDLKTQYSELEHELLAVAKQVLEGGFFVLGARLETFEQEFASYLGAGYGVGVGSGTEALHLALVACGVGPGDEVVTVPNTAVPTVAAIAAANASPVYVDIDPGTYTMDPDSLERCLKERMRAGSRIKAIIPVHLYGHPADLSPILELASEYNLRVIEDCAQAHGAEYRNKKVGTIGDVGCFSFYPTKNLGAYGDGGMVVTDDEECAAKLKLLRNYGQEGRYDSSIRGFNSRLDEIQAAFLSIKLKHLDKWNSRRRHLASMYREDLDPGLITAPIEADHARHVYHLFVIRHTNRDGLREYLSTHGVGTLIHYPVPIHLQQAWARAELPVGTFPIAERYAAEILSLPIYPELTDGQAKEIAGLINAYTG